MPCGTVPGTMGRSDRPSGKNELAPSGLYLGCTCISTRHAVAINKDASAAAPAKKRLAPRREVSCWPRRLMESAFHLSHVDWSEAEEEITRARQTKLRVPNFDTEEEAVA